MKKQTFDKYETILGIAGAIFLAWFIISWVNVLATRPNVPEWNFFKVITAHAEETSTYSHIANHEESKGIDKLPKWKQNGYTDKDLRLLSQIIFSESGYCSWQLQLYVGSVVLNRTKDYRFPDTIEDVVYQRGQYAPVGSRIWYQKPNKSSVDAAKALLSDGSVLPEYVVFQANFRQGQGTYIELETVYFCY